MSWQGPLLISSTQLTIKAPIIVWQKEREVLKHVLLVNMHSPRSHRRAVWQLACYLNRELQYGMQYGDEGNDSDPTCQVFLFGHPHDTSQGHRTPCVGAACFRKEAPHLTTHVLMWVWIHPYLRRHGLLTNAWPFFLERFGYFDICAPVSPAMANFLAQREWKYAPSQDKLPIKKETENAI